MARSGWAHRVESLPFETEYGSRWGKTRLWFTTRKAFRKVPVEQYIWPPELMACSRQAGEGVFGSWNPFPAFLKSLCGRSFLTGRIYGSPEERRFGYDDKGS